MSKNGIAWLPTKEARQIAKLNLAADKRGQSYDRDLLPTKYVGNDVVNNPNTGGLQLRRPWTNGPTGTLIISLVGAAAPVDGLWTDQSPYGNNATFQGGPGWSYSQGGYATFNGTSAYISLPENFIDWLNNDLTVSMWFKVTGNGLLFGQQGSPIVNGTDGGWVPAIYIGTDNKLYNSLFWHSNNSVGITTTVNDDQWHMVTVTYTRSNNTQLTYINGALVDTKVWVSPQSSYNPNYYYFLGSGRSASWTNAPADPFIAGGIGHFRVWHEALNDIAVVAEFDNTKNRFLPTYSVVPRNATVNEGDNITVDIYTTNFPDGLIYYTVSGVSASDIAGGVLPSGNTTINSGVSAVSFNVAADLTTEGTETLVFELRTGSTSGPIVASGNVTINDSSLTPVGGLGINWYGTSTNILPTGSYTSLGNGAVQLSASAFVDAGQALQGTTFTVTVDANMGTGGGGFWNTMWGQDNYGGPARGEIAYWGSDTVLYLGNFGFPVSITTPSITANQRRIYTFVIDGANAALYINGSVVGSGTMTGGAPTLPANTLYIGSRHNNSGGPGPSDARGGTYYSAKVEGTALTAAQVKTAWLAMPGAKTYTALKYGQNTGYAPNQGSNQISVLVVDYPDVVNIPVGATVTITGNGSGTFTVAGSYVQSGLCVFDVNNLSFIAWGSDTLTFSWTVQ